LLFQTLDDKQECIGVYVDGALHFDTIPSPLTQTWKYTGSVSAPEVEYAWLYVQGKSMAEVCPEHLLPEWTRVSKKLIAYKKAFTIAKINLREHCFFDLVPHDALVEFCEVKNRITEYVLETYEKPSNYDYLRQADRLLHKIKHQDLHLNNKNCRSHFTSHNLLTGASKILNGNSYIDYNLFGTVTGRLSTHPGSMPILTMKRELRRLVKPHNDWFLSLDYNGAEVRTVLALSEQQQPDTDIHEWNMRHVFENETMMREEAKTLFFAWLYNPDSDKLQKNFYSRQKILDRYYDGEYISTIFGRRIQVDKRKAFNYIVQSTTADLVIERAIAIDRFLEGRKSRISHIVHDEIVVDFADSERELIVEIKNLFAKNRLGTFMVNIKAGKDYYDLKTLLL
tara:strand:- start:890 stop:2077 length:1188 start_codon:yes stop_codon:yes gene_type:complete